MINNFSKKIAFSALKMIKYGKIIVTDYDQSKHIIGDDENQLVIKNMTKKEKIDSIFIEQKDSKTTLKVRIMANGQQITRLDYDMNIKIEFVEKLINEFKKIFKNYDLILLI